MSKTQKPPWLKRELPGRGAFAGVRATLAENRCSTVCVEASCPNLGECWAKGTMTLMVLGRQCTRSCRFCNVTEGSPTPVDPEEPERVARTLAQLNIGYAVITSVTRDDLPDQGAQHWSAVIQQVKARGITVEALLPDFGGDPDCLGVVTAAAPHLFSHNLETVRRLTGPIRRTADYDRSLAVLKAGHDAGLPTKSSLLLGMGECESELLETMDDLRKVQVEILVMGQYLQPSAAHLPVARYYTPEEFDTLKHEALSRGFHSVEAGPLVRSSYHAEAAYEALF